MKKILLIILLTVSTNVFSDSEGFYNGENLINDMKSDDLYANAFASGFIHGVNDDSREICFYEVVTRNQVTQIIKNFLEKHPEYWKYTASSLVITAVKEIYPCKK